MVAQLRQRRSRLAAWSVRFGLVAPPVMVLAALGHRFDAFDAPTTYVVMALSVGLAVLALTAALAALFFIWRNGDEGTGAAIRGALLSLIVLAVPIHASYWLLALPRLADISTSPESPPHFTIAERSRPATANLVRDPTAIEVAEQRMAYPDVAARYYALQSGVVFESALAMAANRGWRVLDVLEPVNEAGPARVEATARTLFFTFESDVVITMNEIGEGTLVDMRSASRYGRHDLGTNAARIKRFLADLDMVLATGTEPVTAPDEAPAAPGEAPPAPDDESETPSEG